MLCLTGKTAPRHVDARSLFQRITNDWFMIPRLAVAIESIRFTEESTSQLNRKFHVLIMENMLQHFLKL